MKFNHLLVLLLLGAGLGLLACGANAGDTAQENSAASGDPAAGVSATPSADGQAAPAPGSAAPAGNAASAGNAAFHYICPKGCKGGGAAAQGKCPVCGGDLVHNQAFHSQQPQGATPANPIQVDPNSAQPSQPTPPPSQNAAGVYHYTCPKGCAGGSGTQGNCAKCGTTLAHNAAYHNK